MDDIAEKKSPPRIGLFIFWILLIVSAGSAALLITSFRVGQQNDTTFGNVYKRFTNSWGGEINIIPSHFYFVESYIEKIEKVDKSGITEIIETLKTREHHLRPDSIAVNAIVNLEKKREGLITFNSYLVDIDNEYILMNNTGFQDNLLVKFNRPANASILNDYTVFVNDEAITAEFLMGSPFVLLDKLGEDQTVKINIRFKTNGVDVLKYNLSVYNSYVIKSFKARFDINTSGYNLLQYGLPHEISKNGKREQLAVDMTNFNTNQDVGISFVSIINDLDQIERLIRFSPVSLCLFIILVFILSQMRNVRFHPIHYLFIAIINVFYFLFISYIIRFFNSLSTLTFAFLLTLIMYVLYIPNATSKKFAFKTLIPYHIALTTILSIIFLLPIYRGVSLIIFLFVIFLSIMIPIGRSDFSKWPIFESKDKI
ncbi:MAG: inner membrane CreD family protein [Treponema sp.]|nr:inner membrane CreD family protein [Treponema sp.]